ncbi:alpha/beta hydrolase [Glycomyces xiaoerkulensis]|uniref:alpha/beta hydrolase n=1 Tax=Glycomyces xiaoerkulensis TaxID=2038139 RepID=UPI000C257579|nr:alpha/beta hydrolase [Glycomyces xiaoerkulensis]
MAITYGLLLEADFTALESVGEAWMDLYGNLDDQAATIGELKAKDVAAFGVNHWEGRNADTAREQVRDIVVDLDERAAAARRVSVSIADAVEEFRAAQSDLNEAVAEVDRERATVTDAGAVVPDTSRGTDNISYAQGMSTRINAALDRATEADEGLKAAIGVWAETFSASERSALIQGAADEAEELQELIDSGASPQAINDWWSGLDEAERLGILEGNPGLIADVDGIPTEDRDAANRDLLEAEIDRFSPTLDADIADLEAQLEELDAAGDRFDEGGGNLGVPHETSEYRELREQLEALEVERDDRDSLEKLQDAISGQARTDQEYFLLGYDSAEDGKAIVSVGNPDTADNTAVYVPGTGGDLDGASGGDLQRAETMAWDAAAVPGGGETAVVMWLDYDAPDDAFLNAPSSSYAEDASEPLTSFMGGLEATNHDPEGTTTTVMGHSYGTTVIGEAASENGLATDQIVAVASPGMTVDHASELNIDPDDFYATTAPGDAIHAAAESSLIHGPDPSDTGLNLSDGPGSGFGGTSFESDSMSWNPMEIHSNYWEDGNSARDNMAKIFTGNGDEVR